MSAICERLKAVREKAFGARGRAAFARALGLSPSTYIYYEKGRVPPPDVLARAAEVTGTRLEWLVTGQGAREVSEVETRATMARELPADLQSAVERFIEQLGRQRASPAATQALIEMLRDVRRQFGSAQGEAWETRRVEDTQGMIPILGRTAAGLVGPYAELLGEEPAVTVADMAARALGLDVRCKAIETVEADDPSLESSLGELGEGLALVQLSAPLPSGVVEFVEATAIRARFPETFAVRVDGESMSPRFCHGDVVLASPNRSVRNGQAGLVQIRGRVGLTLKLVRREERMVHLVPINEKYETETVEAREIEWMAPVLCGVRFGSVSSGH